MKKFNKKGFTLVEMLVVIAIIAVLVSIVIPTVSNSTEKAKEAADAANIRAYIAEASIAGLEGSTYSKSYSMKQTDGFSTITGNIGETPASSDVFKKASVTIAWDASSNKVTIS